MTEENPMYRSDILGNVVLINLIQEGVKPIFKVKMVDPQDPKDPTLTMYLNLGYHTRTKTYLVFYTTRKGIPFTIYSFSDKRDAIKQFNKEKKIGRIG